jgi:hypothetical protein
MEEKVDDKMGNVDLKKFRRVKCWHVNASIPTALPPNLRRELRQGRFLSKDEG